MIYLYLNFPMNKQDQMFEIRQMPSKKREEVNVAEVVNPNVLNKIKLYPFIEAMLLHC